MSDWYDARMASRWEEAQGLTHVELDVAGTPLAGSHSKAGQYVRLRLDGAGESLFALASAPQREGTRFELLVKSGAPLADALIQLAPGSSVRVSLPQGKGFPLESARGHDVLLVATGSGISAIRSALEAIRADRAAFGDVTLYFGARTPRAFAYAGRLSGWEKDGVKVVQVVSQPGDTGWTGLTGYVQSHLGPLRAGTVAFLCGQKPMVQAVTEVLRKHDVPEQSIFLNF